MIKIKGKEKDNIAYKKRLNMKVKININKLKKQKGKR